MINQIGLRPLLLTVIIIIILKWNSLFFGIIISAYFEIIEEFAKWENKVLIHLESVVVHGLRDHKYGWSRAGVAKNLRMSERNSIILFPMNDESWAADS